MTQHTSQAEHATFTLDGPHCTGCADAVEQVLRAQPHVTSVHIDWAANAVHVGFHAGMISASDIEHLITTTGCQCEPAQGGHAQHDHLEQRQPSAARRLDHLKHGVAVQPITMGTKQDRMQYEMPATMDYATSPMSAGTMNHSAHAGMDHGGSGHGGMDHGMSEPGMAAAMERDMRNKFFVALLLTIPTVLYSPIGMNLLGIALPTFGIDMNLIMLVLSTPVVFYAGWMFIAGAYHSLRRRMLNMSVLIATGVLAAYVFSVLITFLGGETFFEAAAMLVTFVLFGHWM